MIFEKQTLYWKISLDNVRTLKTSSLKGTIYASLIKKLSEKSQNVLVLSYKNVSNNSLIFSDFKYKLKLRKEVCSEKKFYPEGFDCASRCTSHSHFMKSGIKQILNFSFYGTFNANSNSKENSLYFLVFLS
jgi:hypothetical protein